jgi:enoyl-CoA hydratase/carnithine racemase
MTARSINPEITYEVTDPVGVITLNRPDALNAFTFDMICTLRRYVTEAVADPAVVGIVITGTGRGFCVGLDAAAMKDTTAGAEVPREVFSDGRLQGLYSYFLEQPKPILAAINGVTAGGGFLLASMCDLRFASSEASFTSVFTKRGLIAELGTTWTVPRLIGTGNALDLLWSSRRIDASEAYRIGLVERVTTPEALLDEARAYIEDLADQVSPAALADIKRLVYEGAGMEIDQALADAFDATAVAALRDDAREGARAFVERRQPRFARIGVGSTQEGLRDRAAAGTQAHSPDLGSAAMW